MPTGKKSTSKCTSNHGKTKDSRYYRHFQQTRNQAPPVHKKPEIRRRLPPMAPSRPQQPLPPPPPRQRAPVRAASQARLASLTNFTPALNETEDAPTETLPWRPYVPKPRMTICTEFRARVEARELAKIYPSHSTTDDETFESPDKKAEDPRPHLFTVLLQNLKRKDERPKRSGMSQLPVQVQELLRSRGIEL